MLQTQARLQTSKGPDMTNALQTWLATHPRDATVWQLLAATYRQNQQPLRAVRAEAEAQVAHLDYGAALDRFRAGQELVRQGGASASDHVEASIIDTRAREVQAVLKEQAAER